MSATLAAAPAPVATARPSATERASPRAAMLVELVDELARRSVPHCVLRGHAEFPDLHAGGDVDLLVDPGHAERVADLVRACARRHGVSVWEHHRAGFLESFRLYAYAGPGRHEFFGVDLHRAEACIGVPFLAARDVLARARPRTSGRATLTLPDPAQSACIDALGAFLASGRIPERHARAFRTTLASAPDAVRSELERWFGARCAAEIVAAARDDADFARRLSRSTLRRAVLARAFRRAPLRSLASLLGFAWAVRARPWYRPAGRTVAFLGTDGSGKSTVLAAVLEELGTAFDPELLHSFHLRAGVLPQLNALLHFGRTTYSLADMAHPHRARPSGAIVSTLRAAYYTCDYVLGWLVRVHPLRRRPVVVAFDRYAYDWRVDPLRSRIRRDAPLLRALCAICPAPDRVIVCTAPLAVVRARKQELAEEESARQIEAYEALARADPRAVLVRTTGPVRDAADTVLRALFEEPRA